MSRRARGDELGKAKPSHGVQHRLHVPMVKRGDGLEGLARRHELLAFEHLARGRDRFRGQLREVGQGAGFDLTALAIAFT